MSLESTVICMDSSDYMRNGDFEPNRLLAQQEAINVICRSKIRAHPENNVGLVRLSHIKVVVSLTTDVRKIYTNVPKIEPDGDIEFGKGMRVAHLALKHRQGKTHKMRIIAFVGSPITNDENELVQLAKKLKKEKVNVDIINFGEDANINILETFINTLNGKDGTSSHLITIPSGCEISSLLRTSTIICGENAPTMDLQYDIDDGDDPELMLALRMSMEEEQQRQMEERRMEERRANERTNENLPANTENNDRQEPAQLEKHTNHLGFMTEEDQIVFAIRMSMQTPPNVTDEDLAGDENVFDEDELFDVNNTEYLQSVLENLSGVEAEVANDESEKPSDKKNKNKRKK